MLPDVMPARAPSTALVGDVVLVRTDFPERIDMPKTKPGPSPEELAERQAERERQRAYEDACAKKVHQT
jgi:hypothetical protein